jgi:putative nucleotidyltransferase with HDIG domain
VDRAAAWELLTAWIESDSLRRHCLAVEAAMRAMARDRGADEELWGLTGLLHDLDYERYPDPVDGHPRIAIGELEQRGCPEALLHAIAAHAAYMHVPAETDLDRALISVDELCGFLLACAYVRPQGIHGLSATSVRKKLRQPSFAAAVDRDDIHRGAEALGTDFDEHVRFVIGALEPHAVALGVDGQT